MFTVNSTQSSTRCPGSSWPPWANVRQMHGDALAGKNELSRHLSVRVGGPRQGPRPDRRKLVANLPYAIATPLVANLLIAGVPIERMVVMVQWE